MKNQQSATFNTRTVVDLGIASILLIILALLFANIYVIYLASRSNELSCRGALDAALKALKDGKDMDGIMRAAQESFTAYGINNHFIDHPQFTKFRYERLAHAKSFMIETSTVARPPAPWLLADKEIFQSGKLTITKTYVLQLKNSGKGLE